MATHQLHQVLRELVEGHGLTALALEEFNRRLERIEDFLARIPPDLCYAFSEYIEDEGDARLAWGMLNLSRNPEEAIPPFPQDTTDARINRRLARRYEQTQPAAHTGTVET